MSDPITTVSLSAEPAPLACKLTGNDLRRRGEVVDDLFQHARAVSDLLDGYRFAFPAGDDWVHALLDFVVEERACCPFYTFELASPTPHDTLWLTVRGGEGVKETLIPMIERLAARGVTLPR